HSLCHSLYSRDLSCEQGTGLLQGRGKIWRQGSLEQRERDRYSEGKPGTRTKSEEDYGSQYCLRWQACGNSHTVPLSRDVLRFLTGVREHSPDRGRDECPCRGPVPRRVGCGLVAR